ncbi:Fur family transcriptional regulator [Chloroflexota bacterium]
MVNTQKLQWAGLRITRQRALILEVLGYGHLSADEIYVRARQSEPRLNLSTVYRTLQAFKREGLVEEIHLDEGHHHYEIKSPNPNHYHLICLGCGKLIEFEFPLAENIRKKVPQVQGFQITAAELRLAGFCPSCRDKN